MRRLVLSLAVMAILSCCARPSATGPRVTNLPAVVNTVRLAAEVSAESLLFTSKPELTPAQIEAQSSYNPASPVPAISSPSEAQRAAARDSEALFVRKLAEKAFTVLGADDPRAADLNLVLRIYYKPSLTGDYSQLQLLLVATNAAGQPVLRVMGFGQGAYIGPSRQALIAQSILLGPILSPLALQVIPLFEPMPRDQVIATAVERLTDSMSELLEPAHKPTN